MFFTLSKVLWLLIQPSNLFFVLLCVGAALLWTPWRRFGRWLASISALFGLAVMTLPLGPWLLTELENRFPIVRQLPDGVDGIIVLGGVVNQFVTIARGQVSVGDPVERLLEMATLAQRHPTARIVFSGGSGSLTNQSVKEADVIDPLLRQIGLDPARVLFEHRSRNTYENAIFTREMVAPKPGETWILVTSAFHMPRAVGCFRQAGWAVVPYPVDFKTTGTRHSGPSLDFTSRLSGFDLAVHEWIGLFAYWATGKTNALFPGRVGS